MITWIRERTMLEMWCIVIGVALSIETPVMIIVIGAVFISFHLGKMHCR